MVSAVPFERHRLGLDRGIAPRPQSQHERGEQHVVRPGAISRGQRGEHRVGLLRGGEGDRPPRRRDRVDGTVQWPVAETRTAERAAPVVEFTAPGTGSPLLGKEKRVPSPRRPDRFERLTGAGRAQVRQEHPPRDTVDRQMMDHDDEVIRQQGDLEHAGPEVQGLREFRRDLGRVARPLDHDVGRPDHSAFPDPHFVL